MDFTIITPSFKQLDYLGCCIASVADQGTKGSENVGMCESGNVRTHESKKDQISVEHIVQDAGSPGIEEFAEKMAEQLLGRYGGERVSDLETFELLHIRTARGYTLRIFKEADSGMYDAINRGFEKAKGSIGAYLNCDEQYLPNTLKKVANAFQISSKTDLFFGDALVIDERGNARCWRKVLVPMVYHTWTCHFSAFTAAMFFRRRLLDQGLRFDTSYRTAADAAWYLEARKRGTQAESLGFLASTFVDTGKNLGMTTVARQERIRLKHTASSFMRHLRLFWSILHRVRRFSCGAHQRISLTYEIYLPNSRVRVGFQFKRLRATWPGRILNF